MERHEIPNLHSAQQGTTTSDDKQQTTNSNTCISLKEYLEQLVWIFISCSEVLKFQLYEMTSANQVSEIPYINLKECFEELGWDCNMPKHFIPILAVCESNKCVFMFAQKKHATKYNLLRK